MGAPRKDEEARRDERLNLRLTTAERLAIEANAAFYGVSPSEFVRLRALEQRLPATHRDRQATAVHSTALIRIGNNLNQLTRHAHAGRGILEGELMHTLARINEALDRCYDPAPDSGGAVVQGSGPLLPSR